MMKQILRIFSRDKNYILPLIGYRNYAVKIHCKTDKFSYRIYSYFGEINFGRNPIQKNYKGNLQSELTFNDKVKSKTVLSPDEMLKLIEYCALDSMASNNKMDGKITEFLEGMNIEQQYVAAKYIIKIPKNTPISKFLISTMVNVQNICSQNKLLAYKLKSIFIVYILLGQRMLGTKVYINLLTTLTHMESASVSELIQIIHYIGLDKYNGNLIKRKELLNKAICLLIVNENCNSISPTDIGIVCNSVYKTKHMISDAFRDIVITTLHRYLSETSFSIESFHSYGIVALVKVLYMIRYFDNCMQKRIKQFLMTNDELPPQIVCHMISFDSNARYLDTELMEWFVGYIIQYVERREILMRLKDFRRAIATFAIYGTTFSSRLADPINQFLDKYCQTTESNNSVNRLHDIVANLNIMGIFHEVACRKVLSPKYIHQLIVSNSREVSRLLILYESAKHRINITKPKMTNLHDRPISMELSSRPGIKAIENAILWLEKEMDSKPPLSLAYLIPPIHNCSLIFDTDATVTESSCEIIKLLRSILHQFGGTKLCLDVNDSITSLKNVSEPYGIEQLKRTILSKRGWSVYVLTEKDIISIADSRSLLLFILNHISNSTNKGKKM